MKIAGLASSISIADKKFYNLKVKTTEGNTNKKLKEEKDRFLIKKKKHNSNKVASNNKPLKY